MVIYGHEASSNRRAQVQTERISSRRSGRRDHCGPRPQSDGCPYRADTRTRGTADPQSGPRFTEAEQGLAAKAEPSKDRCFGIAARGAAKPSMIAYVDSSVLLRVALGQP